MGNIKLPNMRFYTFNGVHYPIERLVQGDDLATTISYSAVYRTVERVVTTNQFDLIESVALLVMRTLQTEFPQATQVDVAVTKHALPVPGIYDPFTVSVSTAEE